MQEMDDHALLREYVERGSEAAFAALVERHLNKVYSVALRHTRNPDAAEEITQVVFVILARKSASLGARVVIAGWLCQTARLTAMTFLRGEIRRARREQEARMQTELNAPESNPWPQIAPLLDAAMSRLSDADHHAIVLRFFDGKSLKEVGAALGASEDAAKMRLNRAVEKMRRFFTRRGVGLSGAGLAAAMTAHSVEAAPAGFAKSVTAVAAAKGASASGPTLTLIHGALKLMAWTKAKCFVIAAAVVICATGTTKVAMKIVHAERVAHYPDIHGDWEGVARLDDAGLTADDSAKSRVVLHLARTSSGYRATADWIDLGLKELPFERVDYEFPALFLQRNSRDGWKLTVSPGAGQLHWEHYTHFIQPDPVTLRRTTTPDPVADRLAEDDFTPRTGSDLQGYWKGAIGTGADAVPVSLKIAESADGTFRAEGDNPMQGANGQPMSVTYNRPTVKLALLSGAGAFQGTLSGDEISGSWIQGGQPTPASVRRADYAAERARLDGASYAHPSANDLPGHWKGSWIASIGNVKVNIQLALDIAALPDGTYSAMLANIDQFGKDAPIPASDFRYNPPQLSMEWKWADGKFVGSLTHGKLAGTWYQGGGGFPLVFKR